MIKQYKEKEPFSELTRREKRLVDNPKENRDKGYGGYYKWYTRSKTRCENGVRYIGTRVRWWFWRDKPKQSRKKK